MMSNEEVVKIMSEVEKNVLNHVIPDLLIYKFLPDRCTHCVVTTLTPEKVAELAGAELDCYTPAAALGNVPKYFYLKFDGINVFLYPMSRSW